MSKKKKPSNPVRKNIRPLSNTGQGQNEQPMLEIEDQDYADDDALADVRRSLVEEEVSKREKKQKGIFQRVARIIKPGKVSPTAKSKTEEASPDEMDTAELLSGDENVPVAEADKTLSPDVESESVVKTSEEQDVVAFIRGLEVVESIPEKPQTESFPQPEPQKNEIVEKARSNEVLRVNPEIEKADKSFEAIREVALENYSDSPIQAQDTPVISWRQRFKTLLRGMKPHEKIFIFGTLIFLIFSAGMVGFGFSVINAQVSTGTAVPYDHNSTCRGRQPS